MFNFAFIHIYTQSHANFRGVGGGEASVIWGGGGKLPLCPPSLDELNRFHSPKLNEGGRLVYVL